MIASTGQIGSRPIRESGKDAEFAIVYQVGVIDPDTETTGREGPVEEIFQLLLARLHPAMPPHPRESISISKASACIIIFLPELEQIENILHSTIRRQEGDKENAGSGIASARGLRYMARNRSRPYFRNLRLIFFDEPICRCLQTKGTRKVTDALKVLIEAAKKVRSTPEQREQQRRSFAYGNTAFENSLITREMVDQQADKLALGTHAKRG